MLSKIIFTVIALLFMLNMAHAMEEYNLSVDIDIKPYVYEDANVVGDSFYYRIILTNNVSYNESYNVSDIFTVSVYNPKGELIEDGPRPYNRTIMHNKTIEIIAKGGPGTKTAAFPFDTSGDYKIVLSSANNYINFYRWLSDGRWVRMSYRYNYSFDVMPKWQYNLLKEEQKLINKSQEINEQNLNVSIENRNFAQNMTDVTEDMLLATKRMLRVSIMTLIVAGITLAVSIISLWKSKKSNNNSATEDNNSKIEETTDSSIDESKSAVNTKDSSKTDNINTHLKNKIKEEFKE